MKKNHFLLLLLSMLSVTSCISDLDLSISGADSRIYFYCEFEPGEQVAFKYSTATGLADLHEQVNPTLTSEFDLKITESSVVIDPVFRYNPIEEQFESPALSFDAEEAMTYTIQSSLVDFPKFKEIFASTYIPKAKKLSSLELIEVVETGEELGTKLELELRFSTDVNHPYYEVEAFLENSEKGITEKLALNLHTLSSQDGVFAVPHRNSLLISSKKNNGQYVTAYINQFVQAEKFANSDKVFFKVKTVDEAHYRYHENTAKRIESNNAPISEPVIYYSNIDNGLGLFSGYSSSIDSIYIK